MMLAKRINPLLLVILSVLFLTSLIVHGARPDSKTGHNCDLCGPTRLIGCRNGRCYYKCVRRCLGKDNKFYYGQ